MMKKGSAFISKLLSGLILCTILFYLAGCGGYAAKPGETEAEGHRRHLRNLSVNQQNMMSDMDRAALSDKPSKATDVKVP